MIRIVGGSVLTGGGWEEKDLLIDGDRIAEIGDLTDRGETVIDATGMLVGPGFVDLHVHLREPGQTWKEDIESGTASAAAGGFTAVFAMPNTDPTCDRVSVVEMVRERAAEVASVDVLPAGALTVGRKGKQIAPIAEMHRAGVRMFSDDGDAFASEEMMRQTMTVVASLDGAFISQHAEVAAMTQGGHMHEGAVSRSLGVQGLPAAAEYEMVARDLDLVAETGVRYHCQHVSSARTVSLIAQAKESGLKVTAEVTPHHLFFDVTSVAQLDTNFKMYPPLREPDDRQALCEALGSGVIDVVATDHAPHSAEEKNVPFDAAPRGVIGVETAAPVIWTLFGDRDLLFRCLATKPAEIGGLESHGVPLSPGGPANIVVFDPGQSANTRSSKSKSSNNPFQGHSLQGGVVATFKKGELVHMRSDK